MQVQVQQLAPGMIQQIQTVCSECRGQREIIDPKDRCKVCQVKNWNFFLKISVHFLLYNDNKFILIIVVFKLDKFV